MTKFSRIAVSALIGSALLMQGCASAVVSDANRDETGLYDGRWTAKVLRPAALQVVNNWNIRCETQPFNLDVVVNDGRVFISNPGEEAHSVTNIDSRGKFSLEFQLEESASSTSASATTLVNAKRKLFLRGALGKTNPSGSFQIGVQQLGYQGCRTKVVYEKISDDVNEIQI